MLLLAIEKALLQHHDMMADPAPCAHQSGARLDANRRPRRGFAGLRQLATEPIDLPQGCGRIAATGFLLELPGDPPPQDVAGDLRRGGLVELQAVGPELGGLGLRQCGDARFQGGAPHAATSPARV